MPPFLASIGESGLIASVSVPKRAAGHAQIPPKLTASWQEHDQQNVTTPVTAAKFFNEFILPFKRVKRGEKRAFLA